VLYWLVVSNSALVYGTDLSLSCRLAIWFWLVSCYFSNLVIGTLPLFLSFSIFLVIGYIVGAYEVHGHRSSQTRPLPTKYEQCVCDWDRCDTIEVIC
jgi:hypothetical protein